MKLFILSLILLLTLPQASHAGGAILRRQQMIKQRQEMIKQEYIRRQQQAVQQAYQQALLKARREQEAYRRALLGQNQTVTGAQVWQELQVTSEIWPLIPDQEIKRLVIERYIEIYREYGIIIGKSPTHYVGMIDSMTLNHPSLLKAPFRDVLRVTAVAEYDYNNGQDPDAMARQILGEQVYAENLRRLGK